MRVSRDAGDGERRLITESESVDTFFLRSTGWAVIYIGREFKLIFAQSFLTKSI